MSPTTTTSPYRLSEDQELFLLRSRISTLPVLSDYTSVENYCYAHLAHSPIELFQVLYLDRRNRLIHDEIAQHGTVDHVPVYPREVLKTALLHNASALILAHNHPSGDPTPSAGDIQMTNTIYEAAETLGIVLHDHLIIGNHPRRSYSLRAHGDFPQ